ncbi:MAG: isoprenylcysteine carboxylmethyltransferase family protein, partial [Candidatus Saccharimonadales bacterium]
FKSFYDFGYGFIFFTDVTLATMCYIVTLRLTDTHIRSPEPTLLGWAAALVCYEPFWSLLGGHYLAYDTGRPWGVWLWGHPLVYTLWGSVILLLLACYVSATITFGCRFSNITNRGILTNGPYRFTKHPAYVAKNLSWWLISVPFLTRGSAGETLRNCLLLLGVNGIYYLRAKTEEWHLSRDPVYVQYAQWINEHGLFSRMARLKPLRFLTYRMPSDIAYKNQ